MTSQPAPPCPRKLHLHQIQRIEGVANLVDSSLIDDLSLEHLATRAAFSPFYFQRLFQEWTGETASEFVRRRRLETAAARLRHCSEESITVVAMGCGFGSSQAFARSFRQHFKMSPTQWRQSGCGQWRAQPMLSAEEVDLRVKILERPACEVVYRRVRGDYRETTTLLWRKMAAWLDRSSLADEPRLSMGLDDPTIAALHRCRLDACVEVPHGWRDLEARSLRLTLPGGMYAVMRYAGPTLELHRGWAALLQEWLPRSTYMLAEGPFFARHLPGVSAPESQRLDCDLYMPIR